MCGCDSIQVMPLGKDECYIKDCQLYYTLTMEVTNQSSAPVIFDQISTMSGVTVISSPLPLTIGAGATAFVQIGFRLTNLQISHIAFSLISTSLDCERKSPCPSISRHVLGQTAKLNSTKYYTTPQSAVPMPRQHLNSTDIAYGNQFCPGCVLRAQPGGRLRRDFAAHRHGAARPRLWKAPTDAGIGRLGGLHPCFDMRRRQTVSCRSLREG